MNILIVTYSYPPALTPRAFRWAAVVTELARRGYKVHVLCAGTPGRQEEKPGEGRVFRVADWLFDGSGRMTATQNSDASPASDLTSGFRTSARKWIRSLWRAFYWPDFACGWIIPAGRVARRLNSIHEYDWVVTVSLPFTGHLIGLLLGWSRSPSRWCVDIGDPFHLMEEPSPNNFSLYRRLNRWVEERVVKGATAISVTTESTQRLYEENFAFSRGKVWVIPPLISLPELPPRGARSDLRLLRLVFVGTLYRRLRSPTFLLACFEELKASLPQHRLELHFYGSANDCSDELAAAGGNVLVHGLVGRAEAVQAMVDADVLVNIGNDSETQLASKLVEYMAIGRPILNLVSIAADASASLLKDYPGELTIMRHDGVPPPQIINQLREYLLALPSVPPSVAASIRQRYSASAIADCYARIIESPEGLADDPRQAPLSSR
jgi:glycosyltransferase involved in cell wall biosynthesis